MPRRWIAGAVVTAAVAAFALQTGVVTRTGFFMGDFRAFYCAARVAAQGGNPYHAEPLRSCEVGLGTTRFFQKNPGVVIPAPLPGYVVGVLVPLASMPFPVACTLWLMLALLAWLACVVTLARFAGIPWEVGAAVFGISLGALSLPFGEVVPLALGFICVAAYLASTGRTQAAAFVAAGSMVEPHLGLPVCVALGVWRSAARVPLAIAAGALAAISLVALGANVNLEYFANVLPAHALSELTRDTQYSLSAVLAALGLPAAAALRAGLIWYLAMMAAGILAGGALAKRTGNAAFILCVPAAFSVFGGTFIHLTQVAAALPAAVLLAGIAEPRRRALAIVALLLLAVPWGWSISPALLVALVPVAYLAWQYSSARLSATLIAAIAAVALTFGLNELIASAPPHGAHALAPAIDPRLAEAAWSRFTHHGSTNTLASWLLRLPTWIGLALLLGLLAYESGAFRLDLRQQARRLAIPALAVICTFVPIAAQLYGDRLGGTLGVDFRAYYCAATVARQHQNPYYAQPLRVCEDATAAPFYRPPRNVAVPAPYPPYALALFYPFTFLPFTPAAVCWWMLLALALVVAAGALASVTRVAFLTAWATLVLSAGFNAFSPGNVMPVALAALLVGGLCVARKRYAAAAAAVGVAMIEPHVALPAAIALFVALPAMRAPLSIAAAIVGAVSLVAGGIAQNVQYLVSVVPAHALAEVSRDNQFSLSTVLAAVGLPDASAALAGSVSYLTMTVFGIVVAQRLAARWREPATIALLPPAFTLLGGSFVHAVEIAAAVPACLLILTRSQSLRTWFFAVLLLLAIPWMMATSVALFLAPFYPAAYLAYSVWRRDRSSVMSVAVISLALIMALFLVAATHWPHGLAPPHAYASIDPRLAEASWRDFVLGNSSNGIAMWALRLPTWIGLIGLVAGSTALLTGARTSAPGYRLSERHA